MISRRRVVRGACALGAVPLAAAAPSGPSDFDGLCARWSTMQTGDGRFDPSAAPYRGFLDVADALAERLRASMTPRPTAGGAIWSDPPAGAGEVNMRVSFDRLRLLAIAYATPASRLHGDGALLTNIALALSFLSAERYNLTIPQAGNWWEWRIGAPLALLDTLIVLRSRLDPRLEHTLLAATRRFTPQPSMTAANLVWTAQIVLLRSLLERDAPAGSAAMRAVVSTFPDVTEGDGFHADGSFVQHGQYAYTGGYGLSLLQRTSDLLYLTKGGSLAPSEATVRPFRRRVLQSFEPLMVRGALMDVVLGRGVSRSYGQGPALGGQVALAVARLAAATPEPDAAALRAMAKTWSEASPPAYDTVAGARMSLHNLQQLEAARARGERRRALVGNIQFPAMARIVHRRPGFAFALAQTSATIASYESVNRENLHGWYTGAGMTYLYAGENDPFAQGFWPAADMRRLAGTTVDARPLADGAGAGLRGEAMVGGVSTGDDGVACMQLHLYDGALTGRKAWFMFGDRILCAGAAIDGTSPYAVETIIENRDIGGEHDAVPDIRQGSNWAHIDGVGGYVVSGPQPLTLETAIRQGSWRTINDRASSPTEPLARRFATVGLLHGVRPKAATYAYTLLPGATAAVTAAFGARPTLALLKNTESVQCARSATEFGAVFWQRASAGGLTASAPACVALSRRGREATFAVSDPTQAQAEAIVLDLPFPVGVTSADPRLAIRPSAHGTRIVFDPAGSRGMSARGALRIDASAGGLFL